MDWTRRDFVKLSSAGLLAAALPAPALHGLGSGPRMREARGLDELRRGVGTFSGRGGTIGWLVNVDGCVVVDSQFPDTAQECLEALESRAALPADVLINTHHHGDHTAGNGVFRSAVREIVAHSRVPELQREAAREAGTEEDQTYAESTFEESWSVEVGDETVRASHYGPAHTGGDCTVHFERANVVHMGDLVFNRLYPFIDRPGGASIRGWIELLEEVARIHDDDTIYIFGHGHPDFGVTGTQDDLLFHRDFLTVALEFAQAAVRDGRTQEDVRRLEEMPGFPDHAAPAPQLTLARVLEAAFEEALEEG